MAVIKALLSWYFVEDRKGKHFRLSWMIHIRLEARSANRRRDERAGVCRGCHPLRLCLMRLFIDKSNIFYRRLIVCSSSCFDRSPCRCMCKSNLISRFIRFSALGSPFCAQKLRRTSSISCLGDYWLFQRQIELSTDLFFQGKLFDYALFDSFTN